MARYSKYWSCSKFADIIRGTPKLRHGTGDQWAQWKIEARARNPIRYWVAETALRKLEKVIIWPSQQLDNVKNYLQNRYVSKTHVLISNTLRPGMWYEFDTRLLHCAFDGLVNFVEGEFTNHGLMVDSTDDLDSPEEIIKREILDLYNWWKTDRPARPDPFDVSGYRKIYARKRAANIGIGQTVPESIISKEEIQNALKVNRETRVKYHEEDQQMLIRLVKISSSMWT